MTIGNLIAAKKQLIYIDETTFTNRTCKEKSWQRPDDPNWHAFNDKWMTVTVYGAIGSPLKKPVWM